MEMAETTNATDGPEYAEATGEPDPEPYTAQVPETAFEFASDGVLALAFLVTAVVAAQRMASSRSRSGDETTVVTAFYSLILATASLRTVWFLIPGTVWSPYYTPHPVMAFDPDRPYWVTQFLEVLLLGLGSLCLFSIFILILVYWADILKKYFYPGVRRSKPMWTFLALVTVLLAVQATNAALFLLGDYSSEGMVLVNAVVLAAVSVVCVCEITIFSHRFRTVLRTLGDINQVSTESQVRRIVWITVTGNVFFFARAFLEVALAFIMIAAWRRGGGGTVAEAFSHPLWDAYILLKHWSEIAILGLMLYILQSRFSEGLGGGGGAGPAGKDGYRAVPDSEGPAEAGGAPPSTLSV